MNREQNNIDELIAKFLQNEANAQEHQYLNNWRNKSSDNEQYFQELQHIWNASQDVKHLSTTNENEAWARFQERVHSRVVQKKDRKISLVWRKSLGMAAALLIIISGYLFYQKGNNEIIEIHSNELVRTEKLSDGSLITLNKNASIRFPKKFTGDSRAITLNGEAFFEIASDKSKPFIIEANGTAIKVVGTSFNVKTSLQNTEVIVETGIVEVSKKKNTVRLLPKETATVSRTSNAPIKGRATDALYNYYRSNEFVCDNTPLWRIVAVLNEAYDANIKIENSAIENLPLTTTFKNENLDTILAILSSTLDVSVEQNGQEYILK